MNMPPPSPRVQPKRGARCIVDPKTWDSAEVGDQEAKALGARRLGGRRTSKVSSMRSSLFQKNAKHTGLGGGKGNGSGTVDARDADISLFTLAMEADALKCPFSFEACPALTPCGYGRGNRNIWTQDVLALVHNAVRTELKDLTVVLYALQRLGKRLTVGDVQVVRGWVQTCGEIVLDYLDMEGRVLLPWYSGAVSGGGGGGGGSEVEQARKVVDRVSGGQSMLRDVIGNVSRTMGELCDEGGKSGGGGGAEKGKGGMTTAQQALLLLGSLDALVSETCDHMQRQEDALVGPLAVTYKCEKKEWKSVWTEIVRQYAGCARNGEAGLALLTHGMTDVKAAKGVAKAIEEVHACKYADLVIEFEQGHGSFARRLRGRVDELLTETGDA